MVSARYDHTMSRYRSVIKLGAGVLAMGIVVAPGPALADSSEPGIATLVGEGLGGLDGEEQPRDGSGEFTAALPSRTDDTAHSPAGDTTVGIEILTEDDLRVDGEAFAGVVLDVLNDDRGWGADGSISFAIESDPDLTIMLATPGTVDDLCAPLATNGYTSCRVGNDVILNVDRWAGATDDFLAAGGTVDQYREYLINHEVGHFLGYGHELECGADGTAPVMMQQTLDLRGCEPNGWPAIP